MANKKNYKKKLVIVESPAKAKIIGKYLGASYDVVATIGHIRDLPSSRLAVDIENDFEPEYIKVRGKAATIKEIVDKAAYADKVFIASDPDREGEAIAWHVAYLTGINPSEKCRVTFDAITKNTVKEAIKNPRAIDLSLVDAQQARRVLDRLVGYQLSPFIQKKIRYGLSAGRVQSAALKIICDRERAIESFVPEEYWNVISSFEEDTAFEGKLSLYKGKKIKLSNKDEADYVVETLKKGSNVIKSIVRKEKKRKPFAPYTTSTLQQDASSKLGFSPDKTAKVSQVLYQGVNLKGKGAQGLITYIRTDSVRVSPEAKAMAKEFICENYGNKYYANNFFSNKQKDAQDAHEAIRPVDVNIKPEDVMGDLPRDEFRLYSLIWNRFIASQMAAAVYDSVAVDIENGDYTIKSTGSSLLFDGYQKIYGKTADDKDELLPELKEGQVLNCTKVDAEQNFTQPPARFTEASFIKELEDKGIGRPSTYASIVTTLTSKRYVKKEKKSLVPQELGFVVCELLEEYFGDVVDARFTAEMENRLDEVETEKKPWKELIREFYKGFEKELNFANAEAEKVEVKKEQVPTGDLCPKCGKALVFKESKFGRFIACTGYPECDYTESIVVGTGVNCPKCGKELIEKRSRRGKIFYGCSGFPNCKVATWNKPIAELCPECGSLLMQYKGRGKYKAMCSNKDCKFKK
ncbi:MAG: type I DNA topoisomerase [Clostridia bacterium]|nr:type I DNA topoisomerase [Clostridia bacterium]